MKIQQMSHWYRSWYVQALDVHRWSQFFNPRHAGNPFRGASGPPSRGRCWIRASACWPCMIWATPLRKPKGLPFPEQCTGIFEVCTPSKAGAAVLRHPRWRSHGLCLCRISIYTEAARTRIGMIRPEAMLAQPLADPSLLGGGLDSRGRPPPRRSSRPLRLGRPVSTSLPADTDRSEAA